MKILVGQPKRSSSIEALVDLLEKDISDCILFPEGYIHGEDDLSKLAGQYKTAIITSYLSDKDGKDRGLLIDEYGEVIILKIRGKREI